MIQDQTHSYSPWTLSFVLSHKIITDNENETSCMWAEFTHIIMCLCAFFCLNFYSKGQYLKRSHETNSPLWEKKQTNYPGLFFFGGDFRWISKVWLLPPVRPTSLTCHAGIVSISKPHGLQTNTQTRSHLLFRRIWEILLISSRWWRRATTRTPVSPYREFDA